MMAGSLRAAAAAPGPNLAMLAPLLREARYQVARDSRRIHRLKAKVQATENHLHKVEGVLSRTGDLAHERGLALAELQVHADAVTAHRDELESRLTASAEDIATLERSRALRRLAAAEQLWRRIRARLGRLRR